MTVHTEIVSEPIHGDYDADVVMPEMNGRDLAEKLQMQSPGLRCLFVSGYTANVIVHPGVLNEGVQFLQKPFTASSLAVAVKEALGGVS